MECQTARYRSCSQRAVPSYGGYRHIGFSGLSGRLALSQSAATSEKIGHRRSIHSKIVPLRYIRFSRNLPPNQQFPHIRYRRYHPGRFMPRSTAPIVAKHHPPTRPKPMGNSGRLMQHCERARTRRFPDDYGPFQPAQSVAVRCRTHRSIRACSNGGCPTPFANPCSTWALSWLRAIVTWLRVLRTVTALALGNFSRCGPPCFR